jgi:integrase
MRTEENRNPLTIHNETIMILQLLNFAVSRKFLATNPMSGEKFKKPKSKEQPFWTEDEILRILKNSSGIAKTCFYVLAITGMRIGELCHMEWADIDFEKNIIRIRPKDFEGANKSGKPVKSHWQPKNGEERLVPMNSQLRAMLLKLPRNSNWLISRQSRVGGNPRQLHGQWLLDVLKRVLKKLGLDGHLHTFRHSFITIALVNENISSNVVRKWVGHIDPNVIANYTHVCDDASHGYMEQMYSGKIGIEDARDEAVDATDINDNIQLK